VRDQGGSKRRHATRSYSHGRNLWGEAYARTVPLADITTCRRVTNAHGLRLVLQNRSKITQTYNESRDADPHRLSKQRSVQGHECLLLCFVRRARNVHLQWT